MRRRCRWTVGVTLAGLCLQSACMWGGETEQPRYFTVEMGEVTAAAAAPAAPVDEGVPALKLRRVAAASHLRERMVWRLSEVEVGFWESQRWSELPVAYLERALARELFGGGTLRRVAAGDAPALEAELLAFDEVLAPAHEVVVKVAISLVKSDESFLLERVVASRRPVAGDEPASMARAMGAALDDVVKEIARAVEAALRR
ncbi:MAG: ABC-type transport auxiliary lipoprotein family protein [Planctomycetota bacterium]